jgi:hypothetical protein
MARPRTPIGTFGEIDFRTNPNGSVRARTRFRDDDGQLRPVEATGPSPKAAERNLKEKIARRGHYATGIGELSPDTTFAKLVEVWLEYLDLEDRIAASTRELYERDMRTLVMPTFERYTLREMSISKIDRFLKARAKVSYSRAKHSKVVLNLALGLALRYEAIPRNPVVGTARLRRPPSMAMALTITQVEAIRHAVGTWRRGSGLSGPKPDGQLEAINEVMWEPRLASVKCWRSASVTWTSPARLRPCGSAARWFLRPASPPTDKTIRKPPSPGAPSRSLRSHRRCCANAWS